MAAAQNRHTVTHGAHVESSRWRPRRTAVEDRWMLDCWMLDCWMLDCWIAGCWIVGCWMFDVLLNLAPGAWSLPASPLRLRQPRKSDWLAPRSPRFDCHCA